MTFSVLTPTKQTLGTFLSLDHQAQNVMHTTTMSLGKENHAVKKAF